MDPPAGLCSRVRLGRDYYVRVDTVDYSVDPRAIGRFVDVTASLDTVAVTCDGQPAARHARSWARNGTVTDPEHAATRADAPGARRGPPAAGDGDPPSR